MKNIIKPILFYSKTRKRYENETFHIKKRLGEVNL